MFNSESLVYDGDCVLLRMDGSTIGAINLKRVIAIVATPEHADKCALVISPNENGSFLVDYSDALFEAWVNANE